MRARRAGRFFLCVRQIALSMEPVAALAPHCGAFRPAASGVSAFGAFARANGDHSSAPSPASRRMREEGTLRFAAFLSSETPRFEVKAQSAPEASARTESPQGLEDREKWRVFRDPFRTGTVRKGDRPPAASARIDRTDVRENMKKWRRLRDSNPRPSVYKTAALPAELNRP